MKAKMFLTDPKEVEASLTITMKLKEWEGLRSQLTQEYPSWELAISIQELIENTTKHFYSDMGELR